MIGNILHFTNKFLYFSDRRLVFPDTPVFSKLKELSGIDRFWTYDNGPVVSNLATQFHLFSPEGFDAITYQRYNDFLAYDTKSGTTTKGGRSDALIPSTDQFDEMLTNPNRQKLLQLLGVKYLLVPNRPDHNTKTVKRTDRRFAPLWTDNIYTIYEYTETFPRAYLVGDFRAATSDGETLATVFDPAVDLRKTVVLEEQQQEFLMVKELLNCMKEIMFRFINTQKILQKMF